MKLYKLTDENHETHNNTKWGEGVEHTADGKGPLCSKHWVHAYEDARIASLLNPIHCNFKNPVLWEAEGEVGEKDNCLKLGCTRLKTIKIIPLPEITTEQRVLFAIYCAKQVCDNKEWNEWADNWVSGEDRSEESAWDVEEAAAALAWAAAAWAAEESAAAEAAKAAAKAAAWAAAAAREAAAADANFNIYKAMEQAGIK